MKKKNKDYKRARSFVIRRNKDSILNIISFVLVGIACGVSIGLFKKSIAFISGHNINFLTRASGNITLSVAIIILFIIIGSFIYYLAKKNPMIAGSGIPIVYGMLEGKFEPKLANTLLSKFLASSLAIGSGLSLGREGPSVQIGALIGQLGHKLLKCKENKIYYIGAAAGAGISVAFNAPITGLLFTIEEIYNKTNRKIFLSSAITIFSAVLTSNILFGNLPSLANLPMIKDTDLSNVFYVILLGVICGLSGVFFNKIVIGSKDFFGKIKINPFIKYLLPFVLTAIVLLFDIELFASGEEFIFLPLGENKSIGGLIALYFVKIGLLSLAFSQSIPGGSLVPLIVLGSILGNIVASILFNLGLIDSSSILLFSMLAMCGHFSAIIRAPITAIILVFEMSGGVFNYLLGLFLVSLISYSIAELCKSKPFYSDLYDRMKN